MYRHSRVGGGLEGDVNVLRLDSRLNGNGGSVYVKRPICSRLQYDILPLPGQVLRNLTIAALLAHFGDVIVAILSLPILPSML